MRFIFGNLPKAIVFSLAFDVLLLIQLERSLPNPTTHPVRHVVAAAEIEI